MDQGKPDYYVGAADRAFVLPRALHSMKRRSFLSLLAALPFFKATAAPEIPTLFDAGNISLTVDLAKFGPDKAAGLVQITNELLESSWGIELLVKRDIANAMAETWEWHFIDGGIGNGAVRSRHALVTAPADTPRFQRSLDVGTGTGSSHQSADARGGRFGSSDERVSSL